MAYSRLRNFFLPQLNRKLLIRAVVTGVLCYLVFGFLLLPLRVRGVSMEPTYSNGSFAFCWRLHFLFSPPERFDVVTVRFAGRKVMLLKRVVAISGETVEFRDGFLFVNGVLVEEKYVKNRSDWQLPPRTVTPGHVYVVGDNRSSPLSGHRFGEVRLDRIIGGVL